MPTRFKRIPKKEILPAFAIGRHYPEKERPKK